MPSMEELGDCQDAEAKLSDPAQSPRRCDPFADSEELVIDSGLQPETLIEVGDDHRLADEEPLKAMLAACERINIK